MPGSHMAVWSQLLRLKKLIQKISSKEYWMEAGEGAVCPHHSCRCVTKMPDGAFPAERISYGTTSDEERCSSISAVLEEGFMNSAGDGKSAKRGGQG